MSGNLREFYLSSPMREGVLSWYPFTPGTRALDLSGGVLSGLLERRCGFVGKPEDSQTGSFDYVVALDPGCFDADALKTLRLGLNPHGRLLLAYENPFALRYWAGKKSPDTGVPYDTLFGRGPAPLPSKAELQTMLRLAGFEGQRWYYPLTDHWFTMEVYSESCLPNEYLNQRFFPYIADDDCLRFDERGLYREVIRGGAFEFLCGAYLVEARVCAEDAPCPVDYAAVTAYRESGKRFATVVGNDGWVRKTPLHPDGEESVRRIIRNHDDLARLGLDVVPARMDGGSLVMPRLALPTLWDYWAKKHSCGVFDKSEVIRHFDRLRDTIYASSVGGKCYWELVPANCFYDKEQERLIFFDQEYCWEDASPDIALVRAVQSFHFSPAFRGTPLAAEMVEIFKKRYNLSDKWGALAKLAGSKTFNEVFGREYREYLANTERAAGAVTERL